MWSCQGRSRRVLIAAPVSYWVTTGVGEGDAGGPDCRVMKGGGGGREWWGVRTHGGLLTAVSGGGSRSSCRAAPPAAESGRPRARGDGGGERQPLVPTIASRSALS